jgi:hypothetical protein
MKMVSYWSEVKDIYEDSGLVLIVGKYNHKNANDTGEKTLGIHWKDYPQSRGILIPCVIPAETRNAILSGLLHQAVIKQDNKSIDRIKSAITYLSDK